MIAMLLEAQNAIVRVKYWINDGQDPSSYTERTGELQDCITMLSRIHEELMKKGNQ